MFNPFPDLLNFAFFAPTIVRIAAGATLLLIARRVQQNKKEITDTHLPIVGKPEEWMVMLSVGIVAVAGIALFVGYATQIAALLGAGIALKHAILQKKYKNLIPLSREANLLLFFICLSLVLSGAGAVAFDLHL